MSVVLLAMLGSGCAIQEGQRRAAAAKPLDALVSQGIDSLEKGELGKASLSFNTALRRDPKNSYYQLLNALTYHVMALNGEKSFYELARVGYELAIEFDSSNWLAAQQLGRLSMEERQYPQAIEKFKLALLSNDADPALLYDYARACYFAGDYAAAQTAIDKALRIEPTNPETLGAAAIIKAALGDPQGASTMLQHFKAVEPAESRVARLSARLDSWAQSRMIDASDTALRPVASTAESDPGSAYQPKLDWRDPKELQDHDRMVMVDIMILRSEEEEVTNKGLNLLDGLTAQFSLGFDDKRTQRDDQGYTQDQTITRKLGLSEVRYNLNIFNSGNNRSEVLARPSLVVADGESSEFFSGQTINAAVVGRDSGHLEKIDAGVSLKIKPQFRPNGYVKLDIHAARSFFELAPGGTFNESIRTSRNEVTASVLLRFNQTLILGGMRGKESDEVKDGVPLLRDIPLVQYAFSNEITQDYSESLIILVTPRPLIQGVTTDHQHPDEMHDFSEEFRRDYGALFDSEPNISYAASDLSKHRAYRELYETDIYERPWWGGREHASKILGRARSYLYY